MFGFFLPTLLLPIMLFPAYSAAETVTREYVENGRTVIETITVFEQNIPHALRKILDTAGYQNAACYSGAVVENVYPLPKNDTPPSEFVALLAIEEDDVRTLVAIHKMNTVEAQVLVLGSRFLTPLGDFSIRVERDGELRLFMLRCPQTDGNTIAYGLYGDPGSTNWRMSCYDVLYPDGKGLRIACKWPTHGFQVTNLPEAPEGENASIIYPAYVPLWLDYMESFADFPTTEADAKRISEESLAPYAGTDIANISPVNMREKATGNSSLIGMYDPGVLVHIIGEKPGTGAPWYQVRVGTVEGYIAGMYVFKPQSESFVNQLLWGPLPVAKTKNDCALRQAPDDDATATAQLPAGTEMHLLGVTTGTGFYHVMIPRGDIGWNMDIDGIDGYVHYNHLDTFRSVREMKNLDW